jgi:hypothetical protein
MQDTMTINVYNNAPTAEAGPDYSFIFGSGETVHLDGSASSTRMKTHAKLSLDGNKRTIRQHSGASSRTQTW